MALLATRRIAHRYPVALTQGPQSLHAQVHALRCSKVFKPFETSRKNQSLGRMQQLSCSAASNGSSHGAVAMPTHTNADILLRFKYGTFTMACTNVHM